MSCNLILGMCQEPGSASLPCTTVAVRRGAGTKKDSMRFCAIPLWTTAGCFISHFVSETHWHQFVGGRSPLRPAFRGAAAPRAPPLPTPVPCITCIRSIQRALIPLTREWKSFVVYFLAKAQASLHNHTGIDCTCHVSLHTCSTEVLHLQNVYNCAISV